MIRAILLTLLLIACGLVLTLPATAGLLSDEAYRRAVLWGLPAAALVLSIALFPRLPRPPESPGGPLRRRLLLLGGCAAALVADQSFLGFGYLTDWATFTAGGLDEPARPLALTALTALSALPLCLVLGIWGWERALRGAVATGWRQRLPLSAALAVSVVTGTVLALPTILPAGEMRDLPFVAAALTAVVCREVSFSLLFLRGGGLLVAGLYRGILWFLEAFVIHDWLSLHSAAFHYVAGDPFFYAARAAAALFGAAIIVGVAGTGGRVELEPAEVA